MKTCKPIHPGKAACEKIKKLADTGIFIPATPEEHEWIVNMVAYLDKYK